MLKTQHSYLVSLEITQVNGENDHYSSHLPKEVYIENVFDVAIEMADFIMKTILEHEEQED